jgi:hypothetical protein
MAPTLLFRFLTRSWNVALLRDMTSIVLSPTLYKTALLTNVFPNKFSSSFLTYKVLCLCLASP